MCIGGLVFYPKQADKRTFITLHAWIAANKPDNVWVFDNVDVLRACGIPIVDSTLARGIYVRIPPREPRKARIKLCSYAITETVAGSAKTTIQRVEVADSTLNHKMYY